MSDIAAEIDRVNQARERPTLRLLAEKWAPFVLGVFRLSFTQHKQIKTERLHSLVGAYRHELADLGFETPPGDDARTLCRDWMHRQWLRRVATEDGDEAYELTSHALEAIEVMDGLAQDRALISESRLTTILETLSRCATEANPDPQLRLLKLELEIGRLTAERDRIAGGGVIVPASIDRMRESYDNLSALLAQLPGDFRQVEEALAEIHGQMLTDFREDERPKGEVLDEYLARTDALLSERAEGRAFEGALALLRDHRLLADVKRDLDQVLDHPFASYLSAKERRDFLNSVNVLRRGLADVQTQWRRCSKSLSEYLGSVDQIRERELSNALRELDRELGRWMESAGPNASVLIEELPAKLALDHLPDTFWESTRRAPAPPLRVRSDEELPEAMSLGEIRRQGGPLLADVRRSIGLLLADAGGDESLGRLFNHLPQDLRRPIEVFGLLHIAAQAEANHVVFATDLVAAVRNDGSLVRLEMPVLEVNSEDLLR
jgi:hypothetical protein